MPSRHDQPEPGPEPPVDVSRPGKRPYRTTRTAEERREQAVAAGLTRWSKVTDMTAATAPGRAAARARFYAEPDRLGITDPETRERMARFAQGAHLARMRMAKLAAARRRAAGVDVAGTADADGEAV